MDTPRDAVPEAMKDASNLYEVERRARHAERPGFRINELQLGPRQQVPWHYHSRIQDTAGRPRWCSWSCRASASTTTSR
jgi:hypothetical protein